MAAAKPFRPALVSRRGTLPTRCQRSESLWDDCRRVIRVPALHSGIIDGRGDIVVGRTIENVRVSELWGRDQRRVDNSIRDGIPDSVEPLSTYLL
jgi:hypothetical protein